MTRSANGQPLRRSGPPTAFAGLGNAALARSRLDTADAGVVPGLGNAALARAYRARIQPRLAVTHVDDPLEQEAEAFAARIVLAGPARQVAPTTGEPAPLGGSHCG